MPRLDLIVPESIAPVDQDGLPHQIRLLTLEPCVDHARLLFAAIDASRAHLRRFLPWVDGTRDLTDTMRSLADCVRRIDQEPLTTPVAVFDESGGQRAETTIAAGDHTRLIGHASIMQKSLVHGRIEMGAWIAGPQASRGIGTAVCRTLVEHAFAHHPEVHKIEVLADTRNDRSLRIARRLGCRLEGILLDHEVDHAADAAADASGSGVPADAGPARDASVHTAADHAADVPNVSSDVRPPGPIARRDFARFCLLRPDWDRRRC